MFLQLLQAHLDAVIRNTPDVDPRVADAMRAIPRHAFVREQDELKVYGDCAVPIGHGQTISQPSFVAIILSAAGIEPTDRVLEVGAGSGYVAAVLSQLAREVVAVERIPALADEAREHLDSCACEVQLVCGDAWFAVDGQFDVILVSAGAPSVPDTAIARLKPGGRLIVPVGKRDKGGSVVGQLIRVTRTPTGVHRDELRKCAWVPLVGRAGFAP